MASEPTPPLPPPLPGCFLTPHSLRLPLTLTDLPGAGALPAERAVRLHVGPQVRRPGGPVEQVDPGMRRQGRQGPVGPRADGDGSGAGGRQSGRPHLGQ